MRVTSTLILRAHRPNFRTFWELFGSPKIPIYAFKSTLLFLSFLLDVDVNSLGTHRPTADRFGRRRYQERRDGRPWKRPLITIAPRVPSQPIRSRRGLIHWIWPTVPANATHGCQALLKC